MKYQFEIKRFNPEKDSKPHWETYTIETEPEDTVLNALEEIKGHQDRTLTFRRSCAHGVCGSDAMVINGHTRLACKTLLKALEQHQRVRIEAMRSFPIIKDLVVEMNLFFEKYKSIKPYLINDAPPPQHEWQQSQEERARFDDTTRCILCGACTGACPTFWADKNYIGPAGIVQAHRFIFDSRDQGTKERLQFMEQQGGVFTCRSIYNCSEACPRGIEVVKAINEVRQAIRRGGR